MNRKDFVVAWRYKSPSFSFVYSNALLQCNSCSSKRSDFGIIPNLSGRCLGCSCNSSTEFNNEKHIAIVTTKECFFTECPQNNKRECMFYLRYHLKCPKE